uniref:Uncharacterized protein n=1 Tax=Arundo donax TaxID=35708 RepID=A0A0A9GTP9_ARUDO
MCGNLYKIWFIAWHIHENDLHSSVQAILFSVTVIGASSIYSYMKNA